MFVGRFLAVGLALGIRGRSCRSAKNLAFYLKSDRTLIQKRPVLFELPIFPNMQADDRSIELHDMNVVPGESSGSADLEAVSPSATSAAAAPGVSTPVAGLSIMEQAKRDRAEAEQVARIRARRAEAKKRRSNKNSSKPLWSDNGPKADKLCGGTKGYNCYDRPFAFMRQSWSDKKRAPGVSGSICYGSMCAFDATICASGDLVSTGLRICRLPKPVANWTGRLTMMSLFPLTCPMGLVALVTLGPAVGLVIAHTNRADDIRAMDNGQSRRVRKTKKAPRPKKCDKGAIINTITGTDGTQGMELDSDQTAGEENFEM